jgi:hypothetical protein
VVALEVWLASQARSAAQGSGQAAHTVRSTSTSVAAPHVDTATWVETPLTCFKATRAGENHTNKNETPGI